MDEAQANDIATANLEATARLGGVASAPVAITKTTFNQALGFFRVEGTIGTADYVLRITPAASGVPGSIYTVSVRVSLAQLVSAVP